MKIRLPWEAKPHNYLVLALFVIVAELAGILGSVFTMSAIPTWYRGLTKPFFSPPNWLFAPVWTTLYLLMGVSAYLVWRRYSFGKKAGAYWVTYWTQLALNTLWSILFFGLKWTGIAFVEILVMWYFTWRTLRAAAKIDMYASYALYPYLAWVSFASLLNLAIFMLN
jgi:tryptophan-rich sensory protein